ncbi:MAG: lipid IV(A) 3-deoxy-D-manno-octulosonic acid transferase [Nevskiales bacterium]
MQWRYSLSVYCLVPLLFLYFFWRSLREPGYRQGWDERLGYGASLPESLWLHAASVGEVQAAAPLIRALREKYPALPVLVTTFTPAGADQLSRLFGGEIMQRFLPVDTPGAVARFLEATRPRLGIIVETELWPNLLRGCAARAIPVLLASARLSAQSVTNLRRFPGEPILSQALAALRFVGAQSAADAARYRELGVRPEQVEVTGNIKFDLQIPARLKAEGQALRATWHALERPLWIAASTHEGEEEQVLRVFAELRANIPTLLLVLVPRHPQRFGRVHDLCRRESFSTARRSMQDKVEDDTDIVLGDTLGELQVLYGAADVAFVGGSLVPIGGHNLLEPAALDLPIVVGPHTDAQREMTELLKAEGALTQVQDGKGLCKAVNELLTSPTLRENHAQAGQAVLARNRGALERTLQRIEAVLPPGSTRASS